MLVSGVTAGLGQAKRRDKETALSLPAPESHFKCPIMLGQMAEGERRVRGRQTIR